MNQLLLEAITKNDIQKFQQLLEDSDEGKDALDQTIEVTLDTTLHLASRFGHALLVAEIVRLRPDLAATANTAQETPVHEACRRGNLEVLEILLSANPWAARWVNDKNQSAQYLACENGHHQLVRFCLEHQLRLTMEPFEEIGADLPCLHVAISRGHAAVVQELIEAWPKLAEKADENGHTPLHHACRLGNSEITRILLILNPQLASPHDNGGFTPLHIAAMLGKVAVFKEFEELAPTAFQVLTIKEQETVLHLVVRLNQIAAFFSLMELLGDSNALFHCSDGSGNSLLHLALSTKSLEVAECLINNTTSEQLETRNYAGFTALDILETSNQDDLVTRHLKECLLNRLPKIGLAQPHQGNGVQITEHHTSLTVPDQSNIVRASLPQNESILQHQAFSDVSGPTTLVNQEQQQQQRLEICVSESLEAVVKLLTMMKEEKEDCEERRQRKMQAMHMEALQNSRNTIIIIAVLITTVTITASLSPPGGFFQGGPHIGKPALGQTTAFKVFAVSNDIALFLSLCIVIVLVSVVPFRKGPLRKLLALAQKVLWLAVSFLTTSYVAARWATMQHVKQERRLFGVVLSICSGILGAVFLGSVVMLIDNKLRKSKWRKQRDLQAGIKSFSTDSDMESHVKSGLYWY